MEDNLLMQLMKLAGIQTLDYDSVVNPDMDDAILIPDVQDCDAGVSNTVDVNPITDLVNQLKALLDGDIDVLDPSILDRLQIDVFLSIDDPVIDENAEFDYRKKPAKPNGEDAEIDAYKTLGQANLDTRYVPARSGDNPLTGKKGTTPVSEMKFSDYLKQIKG